MNNEDNSLNNNSLGGGVPNSTPVNQGDPNVQVSPVQPVQPVEQIQTPTQVAPVQPVQAPVTPVEPVVPPQSVALVQPVQEQPVVNPTMKSQVASASPGFTEVPVSQPVVTNPVNNTNGVINNTKNNLKNNIIIVAALAGALVVSLLLTLVLGSGKSANGSGKPEFVCTLEQDGQIAKMSFYFNKDNYGAQVENLHEFPFENVTKDDIKEIISEISTYDCEDEESSFYDEDICNGNKTFISDDYGFNTKVEIINSNTVRITGVDKMGYGQKATKDDMKYYREQAESAGLKCS